MAWNGYPNTSQPANSGFPEQEPFPTPNLFDTEPEETESYPSLENSFQTPPQNERNNYALPMEPRERVQENRTNSDDKIKSIMSFFPQDNVQSQPRQLSSQPQSPYTPPRQPQQTQQPPQPQIQKASTPTMTQHPSQGQLPQQTLHPQHSQQMPQHQHPSQQAQPQHPSQQAQPQHTPSHTYLPPQQESLHQPQSQMYQHQPPVAQVHQQMPPQPLSYQYPNNQFWEAQILKQQFFASQLQTKQEMERIGSSLEKILSFMDHFDKRLNNLERLTKEIAKQQHSGTEAKEGYLEVIKQMSQLEADRDLAKKLQEEINGEKAKPKVEEKKEEKRPSLPLSSSSTSACPICQEKFPLSEIDDHVNSCLDDEKKTANKGFMSRLFSRKKEDGGDSKSEFTTPKGELVPVYPGYYTQPYSNQPYPTFASNPRGQPVLYYANMPQPKK